MRKNAKQAGSFLAASLLVFFLSVCATIPAFAHSATPPSGAVSSTVSAPAITGAINFWSVARMKAALPADELVSGSNVVQTTPVAGATNTGASGSQAPSVPQNVTSVGAAKLSKGSLANAYQLPQSYYKYFPYSTIGKVFFTDSRTGYNYVCSGTAVNSTNKSVVDTAGHCVNQGSGTGNWYTNWVFCPQYYNGSTPYGCWGARQLWTSSAWYYNGSLESDFGEAVVAPNGYGKLVNVVGGSGWAYGQSAYAYFYPFGYPAAYPYNGNTMYYCAGYGTAHGFGSGTVVSVACDMTGGSSGGGWLITYGNTFGYVNGHNDFKYTNDAGHMYSPYYNSTWYGVFNSAQNS